MKILALSASPHAQGNSAFLLDAFLQGAQEMGAQTERMDVSQMRIRDCQADYACKSTGRCAAQDDMQAVYAGIEAADAVVFASPVYMGTVNAQLKAVLDRLYCYLNTDHTSRIVPPKRSALIVTQGQPDAEMFRQRLEAVPVALKLLGFGETEVVVGNGLRSPDGASQRPDLAARAREAGRRLAQ